MEHLSGALNGASKTSVKNRITHRNVRVNGRVVTNPSVMLKTGDVVEYEKQAPKPDRIKPPYHVIFEDEFILVAVKPAGLLTVGNRETGGSSFYLELKEYVKQNSKGREKLYVIHRLDREVSGILVFAKSETVQEQIKERWTEALKKYYALVEGAPEKDQDTICSWLAEGHDQKVYSTAEQDGAKYAVTRFRVMERFPEHTLLEVELETGRKNQIRVHLADISCPVVGDRRYGADATYKRRIRLHAFSLALNHPETGKRMEFKSRMPEGFLKLKPANENYK